MVKKKKTNQEERKTHLPMQEMRDSSSIPGLRISHGVGKPLQHSCLGNPMNREAQWATVHGVAKSQTWLSTTVVLLRCMSLWWRVLRDNSPWIAHVSSQTGLSDLFEQQASLEPRNSISLQRDLEVYFPRTIPGQQK